MFIVLLFPGHPKPLRPSKPTPNTLGDVISSPQAVDLQLLPTPPTSGCMRKVRHDLEVVLLLGGNCIESHQRRGREALVDHCQVIFSLTIPNTPMHVWNIYSILP